MCVNYIKKEEKSNTPHTHTRIFLTSHTCTHSHAHNEGVEQADWQMSEPKAGAIFELLFQLFICYTSATPTLKGASHSLPEWLPVWVSCVCVPVFVFLCVCERVCDLQLFNFDATRVCVCVWVDKLISFSYYAVVAVPAHYVTNTCATHSWVPTATSHAMNTHTNIYMHMYSTDIRRVGEVNTNLYFKK